MNYIITLVLNEIGKRAVGQNTKTFQVDADITDITSEYIDKLFPISLVENFYSVPSFLNMKPGEYVYVVDTYGKHYLGVITDPTGYNKKYVYVTIQGDDTPIRGNYSYKTIQFSPDGIEACHYKDKLHMENITPEDVEKEKIKLANQPYIRLVQLLLDSDITVEGNALKRPDCLSIETLNEVLTTLEGEYNSYFY